MSPRNLSRAEAREIEQQIHAEIEADRHPSPPPPEVVHEAITYIEGESKRHRRRRLARAGITDETD